MRDGPRRRRLSRLIPPSARSEVDDELAFHLEERVREYVARGIDAEAAWAAALQRLGDLEGVRSECTDLLTDERRSEARRQWLNVSWLDFKLGFRMLVKYPGLTVVGGLAIAFAVAVGAATFEITTQVLHPTLPLPGGDRVVGIRLWDAQSSQPEGQALYDFDVWRQELESVEQLGAFRAIERNLITGEGRGEPVEVAAISASAFRVARVPPLLGRFLISADERLGAPAVVVIGHDVWQARFAGDPDVVGREIRLGRTIHTVVGVMPPGFAFPLNHSLWIPLDVNPLEYGRREGPGIVVFGRLAPSATLADARAELTTLGRRAAADFPDTHEHLQPQVMAYPTLFLDPTAPEAREGALFSNAFVVMFLILICANVATLVFARTATRESELVVRSALGATRGRIVAQLFAEALVLGTVAAALGLVSAQLGLKWTFGTFAYRWEFPFWLHASLSPTTALYAALLALLVAAVAGVVPALKVTGTAVQSRLGQIGIGGSSLRFGKLWTVAIVTQVAVTVAFLPLVLDLGSQTAEIAEADFDRAEEYLSVRLAIDRAPAAGISAETSEALFLARFRASYEELARRLVAQPGVTGVTYGSALPGARHPRQLIEVESMPAPVGHVQERQVQTASVGVGFFDAFEAPILSGRGFHSADLDSEAPVVVVNQAFVDQFIGGRNPIGRRVRYLCSGAGGEYCDRPAAEPGPWHEIVGVVSQLPLTSDTDLPHKGGMYHPALPGEAGAVRMAVHVRGNPEAFAPRLRTIALDADPSLLLEDIRPLDEIRRGALTVGLFWLKIGLLAGGIALLLSTVGIYSIMSFTVSRRTREIGIRIALGAGRRRVVTGILSRAAAQVGLGVLAGAALLVVVLPLADAPLRGAALAALVGAAIMVSCGMFACIVPVRRALSIEPTQALRADA